MRSFVNRIFSPAFHAIVDHLDREIPITDHVRFVDRLCLSTNADPAIDVRSANRLRYEACKAMHLEPPPALPDRTPARDTIQVSEELLGCELEVGRASVLLLAGSAILHVKPPNDSCTSDAIRWEYEPKLARDRARQLAFIELGQYEASSWGSGKQRQDTGEALRMLTRGLPESRWFLTTRGTLYGSADLLRALVRHVAREVDAGELREYTQQVLNRLTRHLEVGREEALRFAANGLPPDAHPSLERVKFTLALLDGAQVFGDLRYLNTGLKTNDWHLSRLLARKRSSLRVDDVALHYLAAVTAQENQMQEAFR